MTGKRDLTRRVERLESSPNVDSGLEDLPDLELSDELLAELREQDAKALRGEYTPLDNSELGLDDSASGDEVLETLRERDAAELDDTSAPYNP